MKYTMFSLEMNDIPLILSAIESGEVVLTWMGKNANLKNADGSEVIHLPEMVMGVLWQLQQALEERWPSPKPEVKKEDPGAWLEMRDYNIRTAPRGSLEYNASIRPLLDGTDGDESDPFSSAMTRKV